MKQFLVTKQMPLEWFDSILSNKQDDQYQIDMWHDAHSDMSRNEFLQRIKNKSGVLLGFGSKHRIDSEALDAAGTNLKVISTLSVGYDHIDVDECLKRGIKVGYTPNVLTEAVAELAIGLLLATLRRFMEANQALKQGEWICDPFWMAGSTVVGSCIGFIGAGRIGTSIMSKLKSFQPSRIIYTSRNRSENVEQKFQAEYISKLEDLLEQSDIIIICCPLNKTTYHLLSTNQFNRMKPNATLINISRGAIIDQSALIEALQNGKIRSAGLDVMNPEPLPLNDPLLKLKNVTLLPHIGSACIETRKNMIRLAVENLQNGLENKKMPASIC